MTYEKVGPPSPPAPTVHTTDVTVSRAESVKVDSGTATKGTNPGGIDLWYQVKSGGGNCGGYLSGTAQERLIDRTDHQGNQLPDWPGWAPVTPDPTFRLIAGKIDDEHSKSLTPTQWNSIAIGGSCSTATQLLRIHWMDTCFQVHEDSLGSVAIVHNKVSATEWQVNATVQS